jgi:hypothetical protein
MIEFLSFVFVFEFEYGIQSKWYILEGASERYFTWENCNAGPVLYNFLRPEPTQVKHVSGCSLYSRLLALPKNIRLGWKGLPWTKILAYNENL